MPDPKPVFLVNAYSDPVVVRIEGRASFVNSGALKNFFAELLRQGKSRFVVDFANCTSMDSTFLGVLAGAALQLRRLDPPGSLTLARVGERNLELVRNLGLHRLATVDAGGAPLEAAGESRALEESKRDELENARLVLEAHENLVTADSANAAKFQDVLAFLRNRVESR
jgi:anti-sigma B factor antagonist